MKWTEEQKQYVKENYGKISIYEIADHVGRTRAQVVDWAHGHGIKSKRLSTADKLPDRYVYDYLQSKGFIVINCNYVDYYSKLELQCPYCNKNFFTILYDIRKGRYSCGCVNLGRRRGTEHIGQDLFTRIQHGASKRKIKFDLTIQYVDDLLVKQDFKCALSGIELVYGYKKPNILTLSLDRINSNKDYIEGNVQWVHKDLNKMKQGYMQEYFIAMCKKVAEYYET